MIIFISDRQVRKNFKKAGYTKLPSEIVEIINKATINFTKTTIGKAMKKNKGTKVLEAAQFGGRVLMPSEYFGVASNHYVESAPGTDMSVKESWIRPAFTAELNGGATPLFSCPMQVIKNICAEYINTSNNNLTIKASGYKAIHTEFVKKMSDVLESLQRKVKGNTLIKADLVAVLGMKKFAVFA
jgi:hypothetical protein